MKKLTKLLGIVLILALVMSMGTAAFAVTITINQNPGTAGTGGEETYNLYKIFDVTKTDDVQDPVTTDNTVGKTVDPDTDTGFSYTISTDNDWFGVLGTANATTGAWTATSGQTWVTLTQSAGDPDIYNVTWVGELDEAAAKAFAEFLRPHMEDIDADTTMTSTGTAASPSAEVDDGYWLIESSLGSALVLATSNITINTKNEYITDTKIGSKTNMNVGDTLDYYIRVKLPKTIDTTKSVTVHDVMAEELAFQNAVTVYTSATAPTDSLEALSALTYLTDNDYVVNAAGTTGVTMADNDCTFEIVIPATKVASLMEANKDANTGAYKDVYIVFKYSAELLSTAAADTGYVNEEYITYSEYETTLTQVPVKTYDFDLEKTFTGDTENANLTATFKLYPTVTTPPAEEGGTATTGKGTTAIQFVEETANTKYVKADSDDETKTDTITVKQGTAVNVRGLSEGTYYLTEITTEEGYNKLADDIIITILPDGSYTATLAGTSVVTQSTTGSGENAVTTNIITVVNNSGTVLPSTGGIGTTIFYVVGSILVIAAGVLLVTKKRMGRD